MPFWVLLLTSSPIIIKIASLKKQWTSAGCAESLAVAAHVVVRSLIGRRGWLIMSCIVRLDRS